jgi:hypothetical protein
MDQQELGRVVEVRVLGLQGRHYRVYGARGTELASYVTIQEDGTAWCPACHSERCAHIAHVLRGIERATA